MPPKEVVGSRLCQAMPQLQNKKPKKKASKLQKKKTASGKKPSRKKTTTKRNDDSSTSSSGSEKSRKGAPRTQSVIQNAVVPVLPRSKEKAAMPGYVEVSHPEGYLVNMVVDERPDLAFLERLSPTEADCLNKHLKDRAELVDGDEVSVEDDKNGLTTYEIKSKYNEGRYSALYIVTRNVWKSGRQVEKDGIYMMKTQLRNGSRRAALLIKREYTVMRALVNRKKRPISPQPIDFGKACDMPFIIMGLLDKNIDKYRMEKGHLSVSTAIFVAKETLAALEELHNQKYIHRDVKPTNMAFGVGRDAGRVFLMDFGDAVKQGKVIKLGVLDGLTLPYWSLDCHKRIKVSTRTDLESWLYVLLDLVLPQRLPWSTNLNANEVLREKQQFWRDYEKHLVAEPTLLRMTKMLSGGGDFSSGIYTALNAILMDWMNTQLKGAKFVPDWIKK